MRIQLLKKLDRAIGKIAVKFFAKQVCRQAKGIESFLIIRPGGIGDAVLLIPAIRSLRSEFPHAKIDVLAEKRNGAIFSLCQEVDSVFLYDKPNGLLNVFASHYDAVIDTEQWHRLSAVVAGVIRPHMLIGYNTNERAAIFTYPIQYLLDEDETTSFFNLLAPLGIKKPGRIEIPFLSIRCKAETRAASLLGELVGQRFITVFPGASVREKRWGFERFVELANRLGTHGVPTVFVGGKDDKRNYQNHLICTELVDLLGRTTLEETAAIIGRTELVISGDSGILHIGAALGKPTISLFGPSSKKKWAPRGDKHIVINKELPCSPCTTFGYTPKCPHNARCMAEITVDEVENAVLTQLEKFGKR